MKPFLILVRTGRTSRHRDWMVSSAINHQWNFALSKFNAGFQPDTIGLSVVHYFPGGKWEGIFDFFRQHPDALARYEYIWIPDDDLVIDPEVIGLLFATMQKHDLWLAQPALLPESQISWPITLACPSFQLRYTTFVELMAPCFKTSYLRQLLPLFEHRRSGFGLDQYWAYWTDDPSRRCAIIDGAPMIHPHRKVSSGIYRTPQEAYEERDQMISRHNLPSPPRHVVTGAVLRNGDAIAINKTLSRRYFRAAIGPLLKSEGIWSPGRLVRLVRELQKNATVLEAAQLQPLGLPKF